MNKTPLRVCMLSNLYPPVVSGSSTQVTSLSRELAERGCHVVVIAAKITRDSESEEEFDGVHVYRLPAVLLPRMPISLNFPWLNYTFTPANLNRIQRIIRLHRPDVLHVHNHMFDLALSAVLMRRWHRKALIITIHTVMKHARKLSNLILYPADRFFLRHLVINRADAILCPDLNIKEYVREAFAGPMAL